MKFGNILSYLREKNKITQKDLARTLGVSRGTIGMYEIGKRDPDTETLIKISKYFNVTTDYLLGKSGENIPIEYTSKYKVTKNDLTQRDKVIESAEKFMMDDKTADSDKEKLCELVNKLYWKSKEINKEKYKKGNK